MKHVIMVKLEIEAESFEDAIDAVKWALEQGKFQAEINDPRFDLLVVSAECDAESGFRNAILEEAALECEDRARTNEGSALQSESADASEWYREQASSEWYRERASALRNTAKRIRSLKT